MKNLYSFALLVRSNIAIHTITTFSLTFIALMQATITARYLGPDKLALVAVFFILLGLIEPLLEFGFNKALIQRQKLKDMHVNVAFTVTLLKGFLVSIVIYFFSESFETIFEVQGVAEVLIILSLVPFLKASRNMYAVILHRSLNFMLYGKWMILSAVLKIICIIISLNIYPEAISVAYALVISELFSTIASYIFVNKKAKIIFSFKYFMDLWGYGKWVLLATLVAIAERQGAQILTVKLLSPYELSFLYITLQLVKIPSFISNTIKGFMFPNFSRLLSLPNKQKNLYQAGMTVLLASFGYFILLASTIGEQAIVILLGSEWMGLGTLFLLMVLSKTFDSLASLDLSLMNGLGYPNIAFINHTIKAIMIVSCCLVLIERFQLYGVGFSFIIASVSSWSVSRLLVKKRAPIVNNIKASSILPIFLGFTFSIIIWMFLDIKEEVLYSPINLILTIILVSCVYFLLVYLVSCAILRKFILINDFLNHINNMR